MSAPFQIGTTPNPNSIRVGLSESKFSKPTTYRSAKDAAAEPVVEALFGIPGITQIFTMNNFITISKDPAAQWSTIEPKVAEVLMAKLNG
ncbi:MAG TPA: NifU N-terminal domain-containing protein [Planctomycetota bacterium]|nr:NifU N-terminal domain-containing protein [Planctomycetota bacterium]